MSHSQITFVPPFISPLGGAFTYLIPSLSHTYQNNIFVNPTNNQISQNYPQINLNIPSNSQRSHHPIIESFMLDTTFQGRAEIDEHSTSINKNLLKRLDRFDEFMKRSQRLKHGSLDYDELCLFPDM